MRIAVVHSYYSSRQPSGENIAVDSQVELLREAGHQVLLVAQRTDERERSPLYPIGAGLSVATGKGRSPLGALRQFEPDVVHVHNLFPNWGTSWLNKWTGPLVATVHNFRPLCAAGTLYRSGQSCTLCPDGDPWAGLRHRCYRSSRAASLPLAWRGRHGVGSEPLLGRVDRLIVLSERARLTYQQYGVDESRMDVVPNFMQDPFPEGTSQPELSDRWLFVGRLSPEKGLAELLSHWPAGEGLDVIGDGEIRASMEARAPSSVKFLGPLPREEVLRRLPTYVGLVMPSRWPEGLPTVLIESAAASVPIAALRNNSAADVIDVLGIGKVAASDNEWPRVLHGVREDRTRLAALARNAYLQHFTPKTWLEAITAFYARASAAAAS